jgi:hypothetical protein
MLIDPAELMVGVATDANDTESAIFKLWSNGFEPEPVCQEATPAPFVVNIWAATPLIIGII